MGPNQSPERRAGVARYAHEAGWILDTRLAAFLAHGGQREYLAASPVDGAISMLTQGAEPMRDAVRSLGVPIVDLWHDFPELGCPRVQLDQAAIGRLGAEHLLDRGLTNLLFYSHAVDARVARARCDAFAAEAAGRGRAARELWWGAETPLPPGESRLEWLGRALASAGLPLGVMAVNDHVAAEVVEAALLAGLRVPEDVAVVGVDNDPIATRLGAVPLSSVDNGRERVGYEGAALLDRLLAGAPAPDAPILVPPAGVVMRRSTEVLAVRDANVRRATRYIHDHFREPITVADVAADGLLSRRRLQDLFRAELGHGMSEEIVRQRVACGQKLLVETTHKVARVARLCGFADAMRMTKVFRRELGTTPAAFRRSYRSGVGRAAKREDVT